MSLGPNFIGQVPQKDAPFTVVVHLTVKGENEMKILHPAMLEIQKVALSDAEPGCTEYKIVQAQDDPLTIVCFEQYKSPKAFQEHSQSKTVQELNAKAADLVDMAHSRFYDVFQ